MSLFEIADREILNFLGEFIFSMWRSEKSYSCDVTQMIESFEDSKYDFESFSNNPYVTASIGVSIASSSTSSLDDASVR
jgi:hypothetical protein